MSILQRMGNKQGIADQIISFFPKHETYIEPFFGAGGMFFSKPLSKYNIMNDLDNDVYNLFVVLKDHKEELLQLLELTPIHESLLRKWKKQKETNSLWQAVRFIFLSNYTLYAKGETLCIENTNAKEILINKIKNLNGKLQNVVFANKDYKDFLASIKKRIVNKDMFVYCDPPYLHTKANYNKFKENDFLQLVEILTSRNWNFAISEFDNEFILRVAQEHNLHVNFIGERKNIHNRRCEILITNYKVDARLF